MNFINTQLPHLHSIKEQLVILILFFETLLILISLRAETLLTSIAEKEDIDMNRLLNIIKMKMTEIKDKVS